MSQIGQLKREIRGAKTLHLSWRIRLLIFLVAAPMTFLLALYGRLELALPSINVIGVLGLTIWFKWKLRDRAWFWITMTVIAALHVPLILLVPWSDGWVPAMAIAGIDSVDFCLMIWIVSTVGNLVASAKAAE